VTHQQIAAVFEQLSGPKELLLFDGCGHQPCRSYNREKWQQEVTAFLGCH
jgi:hypothetical protein